MFSERMSQKLSRISVSFRPARAAQCDPVSKNEQQAKHRSMGRRVTGRLASVSRCENETHDTAHHYTGTRCESFCIAELSC